MQSEPESSKIQIADAALELRESVQANLGKPTRYSNGKRKNWSLFLFFRILNERDTGQFFEILKTVPASDGKEDNKSLAAQIAAMATAPESASIEGILADLLRFPQLVGHEGEALEAPPGLENPSSQFLLWLKALIDGDTNTLRDKTIEKLELQMHNPVALDELESAISNYLETPAESIIEGGLLSTLLYDTLRQLFSVQDGEAETGAHSALRSEGDHKQLQETSKQGTSSQNTYIQSKPLDPTPINIGFTANGLRAAGISPLLLNTFPDVFQEGMAARADRLFDTGPSAPENWEGELGQDSIHCVLNTGFAADKATIGAWAKLREDVAAFNDDSTTERAQRQRLFLTLFFRLIGLELLHIELGEEPFKPNESSDDQALPDYYDHRIEHFGFRDGLSQPFVNMRLGQPKPGGGNPSRRGSWETIAPGEIYLGFKDQDGHLEQQPAAQDLRHAGTYMVFRKLEQDVIGFRDYLETVYPDEPKKQTKLAAEIVGRWQNGTSLVHAPNAPVNVPEDQLNNFRYMKDDPEGRKCPLGAHVRRSNPRDIGGRDTVKRHRILRRSIGYGGGLLAPGSTDTSQKRGMLFVAMNSRIDLQFELIQARWLNGGEFLGQSGLDKCPLTGAHNGAPSDKFYEVDALSPVRSLPRFVTTKGGDYFFMPSLKALKSIAAGAFKDWGAEEAQEVTFKGYTAAQFDTPELFSTKRLGQIGHSIMTDPSEPYRTVDLPASQFGNNDKDEAAQPITFFGRHRDVLSILEKVPETNSDLFFSAEHYLKAGKQLTRGDLVLLGTDPNSPTEDDRAIMISMLAEAWKHLAATKYGGVPMPYVIDKIAQIRSEKALHQFAPNGRIDLVQDLSVDIAYSIIAEVYGVPGPDYLSELAIALPYAKSRVGEVHPDWLAMVSGNMPKHPQVGTTQIWSLVSFVALVGDLKMQNDLAWLSRKAGSELLDHIDLLIAQAKATQQKTPRHLLDAFIAIAPSLMNKHQLTEEDYLRYTRVLIAELVVSTMTLLPATFGSIMQAAIKNRVDLTQLVPILEHWKPSQNDKDYQGQNMPDPYPGLTRFIYEMNRINPSLGLLMRKCVKDTELASAKLSKGSWVAAMLSAANFDESAFPNAKSFSIAPILPGPERKLENYLMFGGSGSEHACWGRDKVVMASLARLLITVSNIEGLRLVAGPAGDPSKVLGVTVGLNARFPTFTSQN